MTTLSQQDQQSDTSNGRSAGCVALGSMTSATKFSDPIMTAAGERRAQVPFYGYKTLWFNTGTLCNIACKDCYIGSTPTNDRLSYLTREDVCHFLQEADSMNPRPSEIGFTGGEPFMNPDFTDMLEDCLAAGFRVLVLTNAMKPMLHRQQQFLRLHRQFPGRLQVRVSIDHYRQGVHEWVRGPRSWQPMLVGLRWLAENGFTVTVAARMFSIESEASLRAGFRELFCRLQVNVDANDASRLILFPEMSADDVVPEITEGCWAILGKSPSDMMCASSRMVVRRKNAAKPVVVTCTLLPYDPAFEMGETFEGARGPVRLNHRNCARFCVLGGSSCTSRA